MKYPEINTDNGRYLSYLVIYHHLALPKYFKDIKDKIMKKYFPTGKIEDNSHSEVVNVGTVYIFLKHLLYTKFTFLVIVTF